MVSSCTRENVTVKHDPIDFPGQVQKTTATLAGDSGSYDILETYSFVMPDGQVGAVGRPAGHAPDHAGEIVDEATFNSITAINKAIYKEPFTGFVEAVPAYVSLTVYYDPVKVLSDDNLQGSYAFERVTNYLKQLSIAIKSDKEAAVAPVTIPVCYGNEYGPDIEAVAQHNNLSIEQVVQLHTQSIYLVHMLGFMPGFAYMGGMDKALATPRKLQPRKEVPAGSVGIAGEQTGIYPFSSPGGWQIIGRTPLPLFNAYSDLAVKIVGHFSKPNHFKVQNNFCYIFNNTFNG